MHPRAIFFLDPIDEGPLGSPLRWHFGGLNNRDGLGAVLEGDTRGRSQGQVYANTAIQHIGSTFVPGTTGLA